METLKDFIKREGIVVGDKIPTDGTNAWNKVLCIGKLSVFTVDYFGSERLIPLNTIRHWKRYQEPKRTKKLYLWAWKNVSHKNEWIVDRQFYENEKEAFGEVENSSNFKRLDYTMIEVEE